MFRLWLRELFPVARRTAPKTAMRGVRPQVLRLEDRVTPAALVISDATLVEGNAGTSLMTFTVALDFPDAVNPTSVDYATSDGTAVAGSDYVSTSGTVTIPAGATSATFTVTINGDTTVEANETFTATLTNPVNAKILTAVGTGTVTNDDTTTLTVGDATVAENGGTMTFTVTSSNAVQGNFIVNYATSNGTAVAGKNYFAVAGPLNFTGTAAGKTQSFSVAAKSDGVITGDLNFLVSLSNPVGPAGIPAARFDVTDTATGTVTNTDKLALTVAGVAQAENAGVTTFTVTSPTAVAGGFTVDYATADGTATVGGSDYTAATGTLTFAGTAGETKTFTVAVTGDTIVEPNETFTASLSNLVPLGAAAKSDFDISSVGTATVVNDDATTLTLSASAAATGEGGSITYTVTSSNAVQGGFSVGIAATPNAPTTAGDITLSGSTLTFAGNAGEPQTFTVAALADGIVEPTETFAVALGTVTPNQAIPTAKFVAAGSPVTGTITDADVAVFTVGDVTLAESGGSMTFTVTASREVQGNFTVDYSTSNVTAVAGTNYGASAGILTFTGGLPAGQSKTFTVPLTVDNVVTGDLTFLVSLSNPTSVAGLPAAQFDTTDTATGTITNTDVSIASISVSAPTAVEGGSLAFVFTLTKPVDRDTTFQFDGIDVTATAGADYTAIVAQSVTILANTTSTTVFVATADDRRVEGTETFSAVISNLVPNGRPVTLDATPRTATILDNDTAVISFSKASDAFSENNQATAVSALLTITATGVGTVGLDRNVTASFTSGGTAAVGLAGTGVGVGNYVPSFPAGVTFPIGDGTVLTAPVTLTVFENLTDSGDLTATVTLGLPTDPTGGQITVGASNVFTLTIQSDDNPVRTYDATVPGAYRLVRNGPNVELYNGATLVAVDAYGTAAVRVNGTAGDDSLQIDYSGGNPVPAGGVTFDGQGGSDQLTVVNGDFVSITSALATANSGTLTFVGVNPLLNGVVTYSNLETETLLDPASVLAVNFALPGAASVARLQEDSGGAGNGRAEFVSANGSFLATRFVVPSVQLAIDRGNAADSFELKTAGPAPSDVRSSVRVGTPATPFAALTLSGPLTSTGSVDLNGQTIALNAPLIATVSVRLVASTLATQSPAGTVTTPSLQLGVGGPGNYTLNAANNAANLGANTAGNVSYRDANALNLAGVNIGGTFDLTLDGVLTQSAPAVVGGATTITAGANPVTLTNPANDFNSVRVVSAGTVALTDANAIALAGVTATGNFTLVTNNGAVTQTAPVQVVGTTTLATGTGNVTLADPANDFATLTVVSGGTDTIRDANALTLAGATAAALDVQADTDLLVTGNVTATAGTVAARAGNTLRVNVGVVIRAATTIALSVDTVGAADAAGGTVDLRGADLVATASTIDGGGDSDLFQLTGTTTPVTLNGRAPTGTPTGDQLDFDAQGKNVAATANSFNTAGAAVTYLDIETVRLLSAAVVTLDGTAGDDVATIRRAAGGPLTYQLAGNGPVEAAGASRFVFNGLAGSDTLVADFALGSPVPAGGVLFDGGAGNDVGLCVLGAGNVAAYTTTAGPALSGRVTVDVSVLDFANFETTSQVDITNMSRVTVGFGTAGDVVTVSNGFDATAGKVNPALIVSGPATPRVGLWRNADVTLDTAGVDGDDTVTVTSADNAHGNTNLTILTGGGNDTVAVTGNVALDGKLRVQSQSVSVTGATVTTVAGEVRVENAKTLTLSNATVTAGTTFTQANGGPVALAGQSVVTAKNGDILFSGAIDGPGGLAANTAGVARFDQALGANVALSTLTTDAGGTTQVNGKLARTSDAQTYGDAVTFSQSGTQFVGTAGTLTFSDTLDPTTAGSDVTVGGPNVDVNFAKGVGSKAALGTLTVADTRNLTANGPVAAATLIQATGSGTTTFNGPVTLTNELTVLNANNVTLNGPVNAATVRQAAGTGTTTLNGPLTATGGSPVSGGTAGGAVNLVTNAAVFAGAISAPNAPVVLTLANGATQTGGQLTTTKLYLNGAGVFTLDSAGNTLTDGKAEVFVNVAAKSSVTVRDSSDQAIGFEDPSKAAVTVGGAGGNVTLITGRNFSALDPRAQGSAREGGLPVPATSLVPLFAVGGGTVQVFFSVGRPSSASATLVFVAEAKAGAVVLGQAGNGGNPNGFDNVTKDRFTVRPALGATVTVNGNFPVVSSGPDFRPFDTLLPQFVGVNGVTADSQGEGNGTFSFGATGFQPLVFTSIETFEGKSFEAFAVQTAPRLGSDVPSAYAIRLSSSLNVAGQTVRFNTRLDGSGILPNPFVVSPSLLSPEVAYSAPRVSLADVNGDGFVDLIIANGPGDAPAVTVIDGQALTGQSVDLSTLGSRPENILAQFFPFSEDFRGGLSVATGDFDGDGRLEIVVGAGVGGGPRVQVFTLDSRPTVLLDASGKPVLDKDGNRQARNEVNAAGKLVAVAYQNVHPYRPEAFNFFAFEASQRGGANVAVGDFNGDGVPDIAVGAGPGGGPRVRIIDGRYGIGVVPATGLPAQSINDFFAYDPNFRGGVFVDAGRYDGDATADLVTAPGAGGGPHVKVFLGSGKAGGVAAAAAVSFLAYDFPTAGLVGGADAASAYLTGVGGVAFGATQDAQGGGGRRSILVTSPRGSAFSVTRFDVVVNADLSDDLANLPAKTADYQETLGGRFDNGVVKVQTINVSAIGTPDELVPFKLLRDGGSAAGFSVEPEAS